MYPKQNYLFENIRLILKLCEAEINSKGQFMNKLL